MTCGCLEALERVMQAASSMGQPVTLEDIVAARVALKAGPQEAAPCMHPKSHGKGWTLPDGSWDSESWCSVCGKQLTFSKATAAPVTEANDERYPPKDWRVLVAELRHLRARDRWIEEHAKPALEAYPSWFAVALAALPTDPPAKGDV